MEDFMKNNPGNSTPGNVWRTLDSVHTFLEPSLDPSAAVEGP